MNKKQEEFVNQFVIDRCIQENTPLLYPYSNLGYKILLWEKYSQKIHTNTIWGQRSPPIKKI